MLVVSLALALPLLIQNFSRFISDARGPSTYAAFSGGDELFVVKAAESVYQNGYFGLRCRAGHTASCYGGTQILLDGLLLKLLPSSWLLSDEILREQNSNPWPYLQSHPQELRALRWSRIVFAGLLLASLAAIAAYFTRDYGLAWLFPAAVGSSPVFFFAWQGAKNDFSSALAEIIFALLCARAFSAPERRNFFLALLVGTVAVFVRPVYLPMLILFPPAFALSAWKNGTRTSRILVDLASAATIIVAVFLALHPNMFVSSLEANWIIALLHMGTHPATMGERARELIFALPAAWPWLFVLACLRASKGRSRDKWMSAVFFLVNAAFLFAINLKTAHHRVQYYLPALVLAFPLLSMYWPEGHVLRQRLKLVFAAFVCVASVIALVLPQSPPVTLVPLGKATALEDLLRTPAGTWLLDSALQPPLRPGTMPKENFVFFDSLTDSPLEVIARHPSLPEKILVSCWSGDVAHISELGYDAPSVRAWAKLTSSCSARDTLDQPQLTPFVSGETPTSFVVISREDLLQGAAAAPPYMGTKISPRVFQGFWQGMDNYGSPLQLRKPAVLRAKFRPAKGMSALHWPLASDCKDETSSALLSVKSGTKILAEKKIPLANLPLLCRDYPHLCRFAWFQRWSQRRFPSAEPLAFGLKVRPGQEVELELRADLNSCTLELQDLSFDPAR